MDNSIAYHRLKVKMDYLLHKCVDHAGKFLGTMVKA
jgi:hypothetical protein